MYMIHVCNIRVYMSMPTGVYTPVDTDTEIPLIVSQRPRVGVHAQISRAAGENQGQFCSFIYFS